MKCPNCGNENPPDYLFCDECGARLIGNDIAAATGGDSGEMQPQDAMSADAGGVEVGVAASRRTTPTPPPVTWIAPSPLTATTT